jgi:hypothetical protein
MTARWRLAVGLVAALAGCDSAAPYSTHRPFPQVPSLDGALLSPLRLVTIVPSNDSADSAAFFQFSETIGTTRWWREIAAEYGTGAIESTATLTGPAVGAQISDHQIYEYVDAIARSAPALAPDGHKLYLLYLPPTTIAVQGGEPNTKCKLFGGYHTAFGVRGDNFAVVQRCTDQSPVANMTVTASHEIAEAATDPDGKSYRLPLAATHAPWTETIWNAWERQGGAELADLCEGTYWQEGSGAVYQRIWSNAAARRGGDPCIPALTEPFYDADFEQDWYPVVAGGRISIPVRGWATGELGEWPLDVTVLDDGAGFEASFQHQPPTLTAGGVATLEVRASAVTQSGAYAVLRVLSLRPVAPAGARPLTDGAHLAYVGVYVP